MESLICVFGVFGMMIVFMMLMLATAIRIVPEFQRLAVYRLGRYIGERGPGLVLMLPLIDRAIKIDMRDEVAKAQAFEQMFGAIGKTTTFVNKDGSVEVNGKVWNAISPQAISPGTRVRVTKVILEVESLPPQTNGINNQ